MLHMNPKMNTTPLSSKESNQAQSRKNNRPKKRVTCCWQQAFSDRVREKIKTDQSNKSTNKKQ